MGAKACERRRNICCSQDHAFWKQQDSHQDSTSCLLACLLACLCACLLASLLACVLACVLALASLEMQARLLQASAIPRALRLLALCIWLWGLRGSEIGRKRTKTDGSSRKRTKLSDPRQIVGFHRISQDFLGFS